MGKERISDDPGRPGPPWSRQERGLNKLKVLGWGRAASHGRRVLGAANQVGYDASGAISRRRSTLEALEDVYCCYC